MIYERAATDALVATIARFEAFAPRFGELRDEAETTLTNGRVVRFDAAAMRADAEGAALFAVLDATTSTHLARVLLPLIGLHYTEYDAALDEAVRANQDAPWTVHVYAKQLIAMYVAGNRLTQLYAAAALAGSLQMLHELVMHASPTDRELERAVRFGARTPHTHALACVLDGLRQPSDLSVFFDTIRSAARRGDQRVLVALLRACAASLQANAIYAVASDAIEHGQLACFDVLLDTRIVSLSIDRRRLLQRAAQRAARAGCLIGLEHVLALAGEQPHGDAQLLDSAATGGNAHVLARVLAMPGVVTNDALPQVSLGRALIRVVNASSRPCVDVLLAAGVGEKIHPSQIHIALSVAAQRGHRELVALLLLRHATTDDAVALVSESTLIGPAVAGHADTLEMVLVAASAGGTTVTPAASMLQRALCRAAANGHAEVVGVLLECAWAARLRTDEALVYAATDAVRARLLRGSEQPETTTTTTTTTTTRSAAKKRKLDAS